MLSVLFKCQRISSSSLEMWSVGTQCIKMRKFKWLQTWEFTFFISKKKEENINIWIFNENWNHKPQNAINLNYPLSKRVFTHKINFISPSSFIYILYLFLSVRFKIEFFIISSSSDCPEAEKFLNEKLFKLFTYNCYWLFYDVKMKLPKNKKFI